MAIAFVTSGHNASGAAANTLAVTVTIAAGNCAVVEVDYDNGSTLPSSVTDDGGNTYTQRASVVNNHSISIWSTAANGTASATVVTVHFPTSTAINKNAAVGVYSGVQAIGTTNTNSNTNSGPVTVSLTTQDANNFVVAALGQVNVPTFTAQNGNVRENYNLAAGATNALVDNTAASASSVTDSVTTNGSLAWYAVALELRSTSGGGGVPKVLDDGDAQAQKFAPTTRMESQHQQELADTFAIPPPRPPFAFEDDGQNMRWSDWRALLHEDPETQRALPPIPPVSIQEEFTEQLNVDWRARQFEDTDTHRSLPPTPPFAIQDEHQDEKNFNWSAIQYDDSETHRAPPPPFAIQDEHQDEKNVGWSAIQYEDDQATVPTIPPLPPVSIHDDEQHSWRGWLAPAIEDDWSARAPIPPFAFEDDLKTISSSATFFHIDDSDFTGRPPVPFAFADEDQSLQSYSAAGLSAMVWLDEFVNAPVASGPFTIGALAAAVRAAMESLYAATRPAIDGQSAATRPAIDSLNAATRPAIDGQSAGTRPAIDSLGGNVRPS